MTKVWLLCLLAGMMVCFRPPGARAAGQGPAQRGGALSLSAAIAEALEKSAELKALARRVEAAESMVRPAAALPDPMASVGLTNIPVGSGVQLDQDMMSGVELMLSQEVPRGEKRRLRARAQSEEAEMLRARLQDRQNDVVRMVKKAYFDLQYLEEAVTITDQNRLLVEDMLAAAEGRYATGKGMLQDIFQAQVRLSQMLDMLVELRQKRAAGGIRLNKLMYRPPTEPVGELAPLSRTARPGGEEGMEERAISGSPALAEMRVRLRQQGIRAELAAQGIRPDFSFAFRYMIRQRLEMNPMSGDDMWSASVGMSLPWLYRREKVDEEVRGARAEQEAAEQELAAMENELRQMVEETVTEIGRAEEQLSLVETALLPQAEGALSSSRAAYETGKTEFGNLLDNQMSLYNEQLRRADLAADRERSLADLEYLLGGPPSCRGGEGGSGE